MFCLQYRFINIFKNKNANKQKKKIKKRWTPVDVVLSCIVSVYIDVGQKGEVDMGQTCIIEILKAFQSSVNS